MNHALDACAMIAYLRGEQGFADVASLLTDPAQTCYAHAINLLEVYYDFIRRTDERSARTALRILASDGVREQRDINRPFMRRVGQL